MDKSVIRIRTHLKNFFTSFWQPTALALLMLSLMWLTFFFDWNIVFGIAIVGALGISLLLILISSIYQFVTNRRISGLVNLLLFSVACGISLVSLVVIFVSYMLGVPEFIRSPLPLDKKVDSEIRKVLEDIGGKTQKDMENQGLSSAKVQLELISYVVERDEQYVETCYRSNLTGCHLSFWISDGRLHYFPDSGRKVSSFADKMMVSLQANAVKCLKSATFSKPLSWPVQEDVHAAIQSEAERLLKIYMKNLREELGDEVPITGWVDEVEYERWADEVEYIARLRGWDCRITVDFGVGGTAKSYLRPGVELKYMRSKVWFNEPIYPMTSSGTEYITYASNNALENAIEQWLATTTKESILKGHNLTRLRLFVERGGWEEVTGNLPGSVGEIVLIRRPTHPFLAECERKLRIVVPSRSPKTLRLPMNTGGCTNIRMFLIEQNGRRYIRLKDHTYLNVVISLDTLRFTARDACPEGKLIGAFMEVTTPIRYIDVHKNREKARRLFKKAAERGYEKPLETLEAMEEYESTVK